MPRGGVHRHHSSSLDLSWDSCSLAAESTLMESPGSNPSQAHRGPCLDERHTKPSKVGYVQRCVVLCGVHWRLQTKSCFQPATGWKRGLAISNQSKSRTTRSAFPDINAAITSSSTSSCHKSVIQTGKTHHNYGGFTWASSVLFTDQSFL